MPAKVAARSNNKIAFRKRKSQTGNQPIERQPQNTNSTHTAQPARLDPRLLSRRDVLQLQRTVGNRAVGRLIAGTSTHWPVSRTDKTDAASVGTQTARLTEMSPPAPGIASESAPIQCVRYAVNQLTPIKPTWTYTKIGNYILPKRMVAQLLNAHNLNSSKRATVNTPLMEQLKKENSGTALYVDGHLLNHKFGGPDDESNMVPITYDANSQMSTLEGYVEELITPTMEGSTVIDYEVAANYGRSDGTTTTENTIPTSLDMRLTKQRWNGSGFVDDGGPLVQNIRVDLVGAGSTQSKQEKTKEHRRQSGDFRAFFNYAPKETSEGKEAPSPPEKNEDERRIRYEYFVDTPMWKNRKHYEGEKDIVSKNLVDPRWKEEGYDLGKHWEMLEGTLDEWESFWDNEFWDAVGLNLQYNADLNPLLNQFLQEQLQSYMSNAKAIERAVRQAIDRAIKSNSEDPDDLYNRAFSLMQQDHKTFFAKFPQTLDARFPGASNLI